MSEAGTRAGERRDLRGARRFQEALRRAGDRAAAGAGDRVEAARALPARRVEADRKDRTLGDRREGFREEERGAVSAVATAPRDHAGEPTPAELRALLRSLPVAIDASRVRAGEPLSLSLGRSLGVELRPGPAGVELVIRPERRLARAVAAELPGLVAALRARGVTVARAEVRARGGAAGPGPAPGAR